MSDNIYNQLSCPNCESQYAVEFVTADVNSEEASYCPFCGEGIPEEIEDEFPTEEDGQKDFEEFDISKLTDEQAQELHKTILLSILTAMSEFVSREAINPENPHVSADLDDRLKEDIEMLNDTELAADTLSDIEARWHPVLSSFLDSDLYTPDQDMEAEEIEIKSDIGEPADSIETNEEEAPVGEEQSIPSFEENEERQGPPPAI